MTKYVTVEQAADQLGISPRAVLHRIQVGRLDAEKFGSGKTSPWMVTAESVDAAKTQDSKDAAS